MRCQEECQSVASTAQRGCWNCRKHAPRAQQRHGSRCGNHDAASTGATFDAERHSEIRDDWLAKDFETAAEYAHRRFVEDLTVGPTSNVELGPHQKLPTCWNGIRATAELAWPGTASPESPALIIGCGHLLAYAGSILLVGTSFLPNVFLHAKRTLTTEDLQLQFSLDRMLDAVIRRGVADAVGSL